MAGEMIFCKARGKEIAKGTKTCPHCGKKNKRPFWVILLIIVGVIIVITACSKSSKGSELASTSNSSTTKSVEDTASQVQAAKDTTLDAISEDNTFSQQIRTLDGVQYTVIDPETYAFNADTGKLKVGQKYVIDGEVLTQTGSSLTLRNAGAINSFVLNSPMKLNFGAKVTIYIEIIEVGTTLKYANANVIKIEGAGVPTQVQTSTGTRTLDGVQYNIITPTEYAFNADNAKIKLTERYVIDGEVLTISGATLNLRDAGAMNSFTLNAPLKLSFGTKIRIYVRITEVNTFITNYVEADVIKVETL
jgi:RNA polymerase subunit RPABC4/transcription elongation factor Spt4